MKDVVVGNDAFASWTAPATATGVVDYEVQRKTGADGTWALVETVTHSTDPHGFRDNGLTYGVTYFYRVFSRTEATTCPLDETSTAATHCSTPEPPVTGFEYTVASVMSIHQ